MTAILDQIAPLTSDDPQTVGFMKDEGVRQRTAVATHVRHVEVSAPVDTYYWTNFPQPGQLLRRALVVVVSVQVHDSALRADRTVIAQ